MTITEQAAKLVARDCADRDAPGQTYAAGDLDRVRSIGKHLPLPIQRAIDVPRGRDLQALHPLRERGLVVRLDEEMYVIRLNADVHDVHRLRLEARRQRLRASARQ